MANTKNHDGVPENTHHKEPEGMPDGSKRRAPGRAERRSVSCSEAGSSVGSYLAHELSGERLENFVRHIRECEKCHDRLLALELHLNLAASDLPPAGSS
jgi:Putative zinc-finger